MPLGPGKNVSPPVSVSVCVALTRSGGLVALIGDPFLCEGNNLSCLHVCVFMGQKTSEGSKSSDGPKPWGGYPHQHHPQPGPEKPAKCSLDHLFAGELGVGSRMGKRDLTQYEQKV